MTERDHFLRRQKSAVLATRLALISSSRLLLPIAIGLDLENDSMMHQPVNGSNSYHRVGKDAIPLTEGLIGRNQQTLAFISMSNQLKENRGFGLSGWRSSISNGLVLSIDSFYIFEEFLLGIEQS